MALSVVAHTVADFDAWRTVYESVANLQAAMKRAGVVGEPRIEFHE